MDMDFPRIGRRALRLYARRIARRDQGPQTVLLAIEDITDLREAAEIQYRRLFESAKDAIIVLEASTGRTLVVNPYISELTRYTRAEVLGMAFWEMPPFLAAEEGRRLVPE